MSNPFVLAVMRAMRGKLPKPNPIENLAPDKEPAARPRSNSDNSRQNETSKSEAQD